MMLVFALPLALVCVLLARRKGGGLSRMAGSEVAWLALPIGSFLLEAAFQAASRFIFIPSPVRAAQILLQYAGLFAFALRNAKWDVGALAAGVGAAMNFGVIAVNGFQMPVSRAAAMAAGQEAGIAKLIAGEIYGYTMQDAATRLPLLGDVIPLAGGFASLGDLVLIAAAVRIFYAMMLPNDQKGETPHGKV